MPPLSLPDLERELIELLKGQGLPVEEIRLIGLLGKGTRATVFSVMIDGVYHVLKVYDSKESLRAEIKKLKQMTPKDRFLWAWQGRAEEGAKLNMAIIEVPEGRELNSSLLTDAVADRVADRLYELHAIRYRQRVSLGGLLEGLDRYKQPFMEHIEQMGRDVDQFRAAYEQLEKNLNDQPDLFRVKKVRVHGDLWWPNVIVANEDVYLIDWESMRRGDAAEDIAKLRIYIYGYRNPSVPTFFWYDPSHRERFGRMMQAIYDREVKLPGNENLLERLRFYLPFYCMQELAQRYLSNARMKTMNQVVADDFLNLIENPLCSPPDLKDHGYFEDVERLRYREN